MKFYRVPSLMRLLSLILLLSVVTMSVSCSKDDGDGGSSYPKTVSIRYRVTLTSGNFTNLAVGYTNESGGTTGVSNQSFPFTVTFNRTVNRYDNASMGVSCSGNGTLKMEILVNDRVVESQSFTEDAFLTASIVHLFE